MDKLRLTEKNRISNEIKTVEVSLKRSQATVDRLKGQEASVFTKTQIEKLTVLIAEYTTKVAELQQKIVDVTAGKLDSELYNSNSNVIKTIQRKDEVTKRKKKDKEDEKKNDSELLKKHYEKTKRYEFSESFWEKEEKRYYKNCDSLPQWIKDKLKDMPSNKGYIWRDLWFFGEKHVPFSKYCTMFESLKGVTIIHEIDSDYHKVYEKTGRSTNRTLIETIVRNKF